MEDPEYQFQELLLDLDQQTLFSQFDLPSDPQFIIPSHQDFLTPFSPTSHTFEPFQISSPQLTPTSSDGSPQVKIERIKEEENELSENQISRTPSPKKRSRKRARRSDLEPISQTVLTLPRSDLLKLTCSEFEARIEEVTKDRQLTFEEEQECRRQKRLIKNRESAQASRVRKKSYVDQLEQKISEMESEMQQLRSEKDYFKEEVLRLQAALQSATQTFPEFTLAPVPVPALGGSVCLMIVLFVFGLYMVPGMLQQQIQPTPTPPIEFHHRPVQSYNNNHFSGRTLLSAENRTHEPEPADVCDSETHLQVIEEKDELSTQLVEVFKAKVPSFKAEPEAQPVTQPVQKPVQEVTQESTNEEEFNVTVIPAEIEASSELISDSGSRTPNRTYLLCSDLKQIIPESTEIQERVTEEDPMLVTLIFPLDALRGSALGELNLTSGVTTAFIEVTCQILGIQELSVPQFTSFLLSSSSSASMTASQPSSETTKPISVI